jgi:hypothetical protein
MNIQLSAHMRNPRFNKDGSVTLSFTSGQEIKDTETIYLLNAGRRDELGWLLWSPNKFQTEDLPKEQAEESQKTSAQRLRATLFVYWKQKGQQGDFEVFYREQMEKIIDWLKSKLEPEV